MHRAVKKAILGSFAFDVYKWIYKTGVPRIRRAFFSSFIYSVYKFIDTHIIQTKPIQFFVNPKYITGAWYDSFFYKSMTYQIRRLAFKIPQPIIRFDSFFIGLFIILMLIVPYGMWSDFYIIPPFLMLCVMYLSRYATWRAGTVFMLVNVTLLLFLAILALAVPFAAFKSLAFLLIAMDFFFLVSFAIRDEKDMDNILMCVYCSVFALCCIAAVQVYGGFVTYSAAATFKNGVSFAEIIVILFPFALVYPMSFKSGFREFLYIGVLIMLSFTAVSASASKAAFIGFSVELLLVILLSDLRYLPILLFLLPAATNTAIENIVSMWTSSATYGNVFENAFYSIMNFWKTGFGVSGSAFLDIYNSTALGAGTGAVIDIPYISISPVYFNILLDLGAIVLLGFMWYILKIAHGTLISLFTDPGDMRFVFAAGLAMLVGISVSSLFESALFSPRILMVYWGMLGVLRSARIIKLGILNA